MDNHGISKEEVLRQKRDELKRKLLSSKDRGTLSNKRPTILPEGRVWVPRPYYSPFPGNYLVPIMQRQWASHCAYPSKVNVTMFTTYQGGCQLLSGKGNQLFLNIAFYLPEDYDSLCKFKKHRFYNLFKGDNEIYEIEFGGVTDAAIQITSEILTDVFDIPVYKEIATTFETWD